MKKSIFTLLLTSLFTIGSFPGNMFPFTPSNIKVAEESTLENNNSERFEHLKFYALGDSIIEGYGNDFNGILEYVTKTAGGEIEKDYSLSGARLIADNSNITSIQTQVDFLKNRFEIVRYDENTVIILDGGGNDMMILSEESDIKDMAKALSGCYKKINAIQEKYQVTAPVIYILPDLSIFGETYEKWADAMKETSKKESNVYVIDCATFFEEEDINSDNVHVTDSGYKKITEEISQILKDWYSQPNNCEK